MGFRFEEEKGGGREGQWVSNGAFSKEGVERNQGGTNDTPKENGRIFKRVI